MDFEKQEDKSKRDQKKQTGNYYLQKSKYPKNRIKSISLELKICKV